MLRPIRTTFLCFSGPKGHVFHASMKNMTFRPWYHIIVFTATFKPQISL